MKNYIGKEIKIAGKWYPLTIPAESTAAADVRLERLLKNSKGSITAARGEWKENN